MLHIIKQFTQLFSSYVAFNFAGGGSESQGVSFTPESKEKVADSAINFVNKLEDLEFQNYGNTMTGFSTPVDANSPSFQKKDIQKSLQALGYDISYTNKAGEIVDGAAAIDGDLGSAYKRAIKELQKDLGIEQSGELNQSTIDRIQVIEKKLVLKREINAETTTKVVSFDTELVESNPDIKVKRIALDSHKTKFANEKKSRENVDAYSFSKLINEIEKRLITNGETIRVYYKVVDLAKHGDTPEESHQEPLDITKDNYIAYLVDDKDNYLWMEKVANKLGYKDNRSFWTKITKWNINFKGESIALGELEKNRAKIDAINLAKLDTTNFDTVKNYLFDLDTDGDIDTGLRDALTEVSIDDYVKSEDDLKNILGNLGFGTDLNVLKQLSFRDRFATRIVETIKVAKVPFPVLTFKNGYRDYTSLFIEEESKIVAGIESVINNEKVLEQVKEELKKDGEFNNLSDEEKDEKIAEAITVKKDLTIAVALGYVKGLSVRGSLEDLTNGVLDGISAGINGKGEVGMAIDKKLIEEKLKGYGIKVTAGLSTSGVGLHGSVSRDLGNEFEDSTARLTTGAGVGVSFNGEVYNIFTASITNPSVDNVEGINKILGRETKVFDKVMEGIVNGKISSSDFSDEEINSWYDKSVLLQGLSEQQLYASRNNIDDLVSKYEGLIKPVENKENRKTLVRKLKKSVLENMVNNLYTGKSDDGEGNFQVNGIGGFCVPDVVAGIYPIMEYNWVSYDVEENKFGNEIASRLPGATMNLRDFVEKYGKDNIEINGDQIIVESDSVNVTMPEGLLAVDKNGKTTITADKGVNMDAVVTQRYIADKDENATFKRYDLNISVKGEKASNAIESAGLFEEFEGYKDLMGAMNGVEKGFNYKTRHNVSGELLNPNATTDVRWKSLEQLAELGDKRKDRKYKDGLGIGALGETDFFEIVKSEKTEVEKKYIISRVSQFLKKSEFADVIRKKIGKDGSEINANTVAEVIALDTARRTKMEKGTFGFSFKDEADAYYKLLLNGKIGTEQDSGISFDGASTLVNGSSKKGVDVFKGGSDMITVGDKIIMVEITNEDKVTKLKEIAKLAKIDDVDNLIFKFYKDPYGFDDRVQILRKPGAGLEVSEGSLTGRGTTQADHIKQVNHSIGLTVIATIDLSEPTPKVVEKPEKKPEKKPKEKPNTPEEKPVEPVTSKEPVVNTDPVSDTEIENIPDDSGTDQSTVIPVVETNPTTGETTVTNTTTNTKQPDM